MKKYIFLSFVGAFLILVLAGCAGSQSKDPNSNLMINKNGSITATIKEDFKESYYDINELKTSVDEEISSYNSTHDGAIKLDKVALENDKAIVVMEYTTSLDYSAFNNEQIFVGSASEALLNGYSLDVIMTDIKDATKTIAESDIKTMGKEKILISDSKDTIYLPGKVLYVNDNTYVMEDGKSVKLKDGVSGLIYAIYK